MILTDKKIKELAKESKLITPFEEENLQSESYDVTIGTELTVMKKAIRCLDISKQEDIDSAYQHIDFSSEGYIISPKEYVLVSLEEKIKLPDNLTAHVRPKTRYTRLGLIVGDQHCNSTYAGHLMRQIIQFVFIPALLLPSLYLKSWTAYLLLKSCMRIRGTHIIRMRMVHLEVLNLTTSI